MKTFVIAFPLPFPFEKTWGWMQSHGWIASPPTSPELRIKGITTPFQAYLRPPHPDLLTLFLEHRSLDPQERLAIHDHQGLLFLTGFHKDRNHFLATQESISLILKEGIAGILIENSGAAHSATAWLQDCSGETLEGWLNWIQAKGVLRTLGLEWFGLPDLSIPISQNDDPELLQSDLVEIADLMFLDQQKLSSGHQLELSNGREYVLRQEPRPPYPKNHPHHNACGSLQLVPPATGK
ncbi:MAG TPA: hypothetical protein VLM37_08045 [Fibrobacteraceae bacterium]|nr:hypothetical protein [Fibrobacteraceae bacterium]